MSRETFNKLPNPKFKQGQYITDGEDQEFEISFVEWFFIKKSTIISDAEYLFAKIHESDAKLTGPPKHPLRDKQ